MHRVRSDLLVAEPGATRVKRVAAQWGFTEMGRFAVEYKRLFGESPSETLVRKAPKPSVRLADVLGRRPDR
jgi:AraC family ethanolamine operon transcriptional activator